MPSVIVQADRQLPSIITRSPMAAALCILATYIGINPPGSLVIVRALAGSVQSREDSPLVKDALPGGFSDRIFGRNFGVDIGNELGDDRIGRSYPFGSRPIQHEAWYIVFLLVPRIGHFRSRDLFARKFYASNFEQIRAQTLPEWANILISTTT